MAYNVNKSGSKWKYNGKNAQKKGKDPVDQLIEELNSHCFVVTTKTNFLNYVFNNCRIKDGDIAMKAWAALSTPSSSGYSSSSARETPLPSSSKENSLHGRVTSSSNQRTPAQNTNHYQNSVPKVVSRNPKNNKFAQRRSKDIPKDPLQFAREKIRHLQNKLNFRSNMQDAYAEAKNKGAKKVLEELLVFEKNVPYTEERFKNFLKHNIKVHDEELVHKIWLGIMYGFDDEDRVEVERRNKNGVYRNGEDDDEITPKNVPSDSDFFWDYYDAEYDESDDFLDDIFAECGVDDI